MLETVAATRYVAPLREGGSLPGIMEADDLGTYVVKFRGAGQGLKVLVAEVIVAELARRLGFSVPELRLIEVAAAIGKYEADEEVQDLLTASVGLNLAMDFLPGAFGWDAGCEVTAELAARILWLDAFTANVDRSWRNPNLLVWHRNVWLIDHGAALYFHHSWPSFGHSWQGPEPDSQRFAHQPYLADEHVLAGRTDRQSIVAAASELTPAIDRALCDEVLAQVPDRWLGSDALELDVSAVRQTYTDFLTARAAHQDSWLPL